MNLAEMLAIVRQDLKDEDETNYRWTDDELERHIAHAVRDFSLSCPLEAKAVIETVSASREIDISSLTARTGIEAVEYPVGLIPVRYQRYAVWSDTLTLIGEDIPDGSDCNIYYTQLHTLNAEGSTIPAQFADLVTGGAAGYAAVAWAGYAINRVNTGGVSTPQDLLAWGQQKLAAFRADLRKHGLKNKVRVHQLYTPYYQPVSQSSEPGP